MGRRCADVSVKPYLHHSLQKLLSLTSQSAAIHSSNTQQYTAHTTHRHIWSCVAEDCGHQQATHKQWQGGWLHVE